MKPCDNCPWRRDAPVGYWDPQHFQEIWRNCQDDGANLMLCHKAMKLPAPERPRLICQGWVRVIGLNAIGVRLAVMTGRVSDEELHDTEGPALYESFKEMMEANDIGCPKRNKVVEPEN
jgi:uncharacterized protein DUF6283